MLCIKVLLLFLPLNICLCMVCILMMQAGQDSFGAGMNVALSSASHRQGTTTTQLFFMCGGLVLRICYVILGNVLLIVPYSKNLAYSQCTIYCTKVVLVWIFLANWWESSKIVSWCGSCINHKWQEVKEWIARR